jgi:hypothetical protein
MPDSSARNRCSTNQECLLLENYALCLALPEMKEINTDVFEAKSCFDCRGRLLPRNSSILCDTGSANPATRRSTAKAVTFNKDVAPIFFQKCADCHHAGEAAPFSVLSYKELRPWAKSIKEKVANRSMPPWHADPHFGQFANDRR